MKRQIQFYSIDSLSRYYISLRVTGTVRQELSTTILCSVPYRILYGTRSRYYIRSPGQGQFRCCEELKPFYSFFSRSSCFVRAGNWHLFVAVRFLYFNQPVFLPGTGCPGAPAMMACWKTWRLCLLIWTGESGT